MSRDSERILFLIDRESDPQKVIDFAVQARSQYRKYILWAKKEWGSRHTYRIEYIKSYLFHKRFLLTNSE